MLLCALVYARVFMCVFMWRRSRMRSHAHVDPGMIEVYICAHVCAHVCSCGVDPIKMRSHPHVDPGSSRPSAHVYVCSCGVDPG